MAPPRRAIADAAIVFSRFRVRRRPASCEECIELSMVLLGVTMLLGGVSTHWCRYATIRHSALVAMRSGNWNDARVMEWRWLSVLLTGEARTPAKTDEERAKLLNTLSAYTGTYRFEGEKWTTKVEVASNPAWVGTEEVRNVKVDGQQMVVSTAWRMMPNFADKGMTRSL